MFYNIRFKRGTDHQHGSIRGAGGEGRIRK